MPTLSLHSPGTQPTVALIAFFLCSEKSKLSLLFWVLSDFTRVLLLGDASKVSKRRPPDPNATTTGLKRMVRR